MKEHVKVTWEVKKKKFVIKAEMFGLLNSVFKLCQQLVNIKNCLPMNLLKIRKLEKGN